MKPNNTLKSLVAAVALFTAAPSAQAEKMTDAQRACVQRALKNPNADTKAVQACVAAETPAGDPDKAKKILAPDSAEAQALFTTLEARFREKSPVRPVAVKFADVKNALSAHPNLLFSLNEMEKTGGQPDLIAVEGNTYVFADVSAESPEGRRNLNYDEAKAMADAAGYEMMPREVYEKLQKKIPLDAQTFSRLLTDAETRASGFALSGYRDGGVVHVYRVWAGYRDPDLGFRGLLRVPKF